MATRPPQVKFHLTAELEQYASQSRRVAIRHTSGHRLIAVVEIVSPGNKGLRHAMASFVNKLLEFLRSGVHLLVIDLFAPSARDPQGIHKRIWDEVVDSDFVLPLETPLTMAAYRAESFPEAFVEPIAVGQPLPEMPVFITADTYIPLPLEGCYMAAWEAVPVYWQRIVAGS